MEIIELGSFPIHTAVAQIGVESLGDSKSRVSFKMAFKPKYGPLGWVMGKTVMANQFRKILGQVLAGLEKHALTGEIVARKPRTAAAPAAA